MTRSSFKAAKSGDYLSYLQPFVETVTNKILETDRIFGRFFELNDFTSRRFDGRFSIPNLVDNIPMPIFINDEDFRFLECNLAFQNFVGVAKEQIIGKTIFDIFPSHFGFEIQKEEDEVRKNNQKIDCECNFFLNDKELDVNLSIVPLIDDRKKLYGFIGILNDITGFKSNEKSLKILSITDELTGLYNRRGLRELTQRELKLCVRNKSYFSVIMLDIDFFKLYNDNYGHSFGDICLQTVANVLKKSCKRPYDIVSRFGGEEFILVLPYTDKKGSLVVAESVVDGLINKNISHDKSPFKKVTASMGIYSIIPDKDSLFENVVLEVDKLLYRAKQNGRNRYESN